MSSHEIVIVELVVVLGHMALDLAGVHPGHKVLLATRDEEGRVCHCLWPYPDVSLLDQAHSILYLGGRQCI